MKIEKEHPYWHVRSVLAPHKADITKLNFSYYNYLPQSLTDIRTHIPVKIDSFYEEDQISAIMSLAPENHEVAIHSTIDMKSGHTLHLPMVDMSTQSTARLKKLQPFLAENSMSDFYWYNSGRSYHGYGTNLIDTETWIELMGIFLLANPINEPPTVDPRWIGHRLIAGYSALRWTKNTAHYKKQPSKILA